MTNGEQRLETTDIFSALREASVSGASAVLRVEVVGDVGYVFVLNGEPAHASTLELEGEAAVRAILSWGSGTLTWCERRWPRQRSLYLSWSELRSQPDPGPTGAGPAAPDPAPATSPALPALPEEPAAVEHGPSPEDVHFPSSVAIRRVLAHAACKDALCVTSGGAVVTSDEAPVRSRGAIAASAGRSRALAAILKPSLLLGDSLGGALGLGPLVAAEAYAPGLHRLLARSSDESSIVECAESAQLELARAFLKL